MTPWLSVVGVKGLMKLSRGPVTSNSLFSPLLILHTPLSQAFYYKGRRKKIQIFWTWVGTSKPSLKEGGSLP